MNGELDMKKDEVLHEVRYDTAQDGVGLIAIASAA
jgi:hypothetical protein